MSGRVVTRALPVSALVAAAAIAAVVLSPTVRRELSVSFTRQPTPYVELYFTNPDSARSCPAESGELPIDATVRSHLADPATIAYDVSVATASRTFSRRTSTVATSPGQPSAVQTTVRVPARGAYDVSVTLPGRSEHLLLHCGTTDGAP